MITGTRMGVFATAMLACSAPCAQPADPAHDHVHEVSPPAAPLPGESLYQLLAELDSAAGGNVTLASLAGTPVVVTMFYASCTSVCPILTLQMQRIELALEPTDRRRVRFVMISLDAERDTASNLASFAVQHHLDASRWLIAHVGAADVRTIAAALGVRYRQLPDKSFSHSSVITLLDARGVPLQRTQVIAAPDPEFLAGLHALLR
jgi:protein SCO1/2